MRRVAWHLLCFTIALAMICGAALALQAIDRQWHPNAPYADSRYQWHDETFGP